MGNVYLVYLQVSFIAYFILFSILKNIYRASGDTKVNSQVTFIAFKMNILLGRIFWIYYYDPNLLPLPLSRISLVFLTNSRLEQRGTTFKVRYFKKLKRQWFRLFFSILQL